MQLTNKYNLPPSFVDVVKELNYDLSESDPLRIGITTLINPPRIRLLSVRHWKEMEEDTSNHLWRILGSAVHHVMSKVDDTHRLVEEKIIEVVDGITLVGVLDLYDAKEKIISDYKITSIWSVKNEVKAEWEQQLNCYCWFLRRAGFEVNKIHIHAILKDWRRGESLKYGDYPPIPFQTVEIKLWSIEEQEAFIKQRIKEYKVALQLSDEELPLCSAKERWKKADEYAIYKNKNKTATRVLDTEDEAKKYILEIGKTKDVYRIEKRTGSDLRCQDYCSCNKFCPYWKEVYGEHQKV